MSCTFYLFFHTSFLFNLGTNKLLIASSPEGFTYKSSKKKSTNKDIELVSEKKTLDAFLLDYYLLFIPLHISSFLIICISLLFCKSEHNFSKEKNTLKYLSINEIGFVPFSILDFIFCKWKKINSHHIKDTVFGAYHSTSNVFT